MRLRGALLDRLVALREDPPPLLTLLGPGGIGKTWLAQHLVRATPSAVFVDLSAEATRAGLVLAVADAVGARTGARDLDASIALVGGHLATRPWVVLDNLEQLRDAAGVVGAWLEAGARIVATTRTPLGLPAEEVVPVEPMTAVESTALFLAHADPAVVDAQRDAPMVAEIVQVLGGNPLAIELAAGTTPLAGPAQIVRALRGGGGLEDLSGDKTPRHASLAAVVRSTWELLDSDDRWAVRRLAAFAGGFELEGAVRLGVPAARLARLQRWSLVARQVEDGQVRLKLYEEVRSFVRREAPPDRAMLVAWASSVLDQAAEDVRTRSGGVGSRHGRLLPDLFRAVDVLPAAHADGGSDEGATDEGLTELAALAMAHAFRYLAERHAGHALTWVAAHAELVGHLREDERGRLQILRLRALRRSGRSQQALDLADGMLEQGPSPSLAARLRVERASLLLRVGRYEEAVDACTEALPAIEAGDRVHLPFALRTLGTACRMSGRYPEARGAYERALQVAETEGVGAECFSTLGQLILLRTVPDLQAEAYYERALAMTEGSDEPAGLAGMVHSWLATRYLKQCRVDLAEPILDRARPYLAGRGDVQGLVELETSFAEASAATEPMALVAPRVDGALRLALEHGVSFALARLYTVRGLVAHLDGRLDAAVSEYRLAQTAEGAARVPEIADLLALARAERGEQVQTAGLAPATVCAVAVWRGGTRDALRGALADLGDSIGDLLMRRAISRAMVGAVWRVAEDGRWFEPPSRDRVDLGRRRAPRLILEHLLERRVAAPGEEVAGDALVRVGWPGERILERSAKMRLHTAVRDLRGLGLDGLLETTGGGYRLSPGVPVEALDPKG